MVGVRAPERLRPSVGDRDQPWPSVGVRDRVRPSTGLFEFPRNPLVEYRRLMNLEACKHRLRSRLVESASPALAYRMPRGGEVKLLSQAWRSRCDGAKPANQWTARAGQEKRVFRIQPTPLLAGWTGLKLKTLDLTSGGAYRTKGSLQTL